MLSQSSEYKIIFCLKLEFLSKVIKKGDSNICYRGLLLLCYNKLLAHHHTGEFASKPSK